MAEETTASVDLKDLLEAGAHFGHQARRWNPKMQKYIFTTRDGVHIFDLAQTAEQLKLAMEFVLNLVKEGKEVIFLGGKRQAQAIVKEEALRVGAPYVTERWLGGRLTNWEMMEGRIKKLKDLKSKRAAGELNHYTKRELVLVDREIAKLERFFGGLVNLTKLPDALFIVDTHRENPAVKEANKHLEDAIKEYGNADPTLADYPIPINDDAVRAIKLAVTKVADAYAQGKALRNKGQAPSSTTQTPTGTQTAKVTQTAASPSLGTTPGQVEKPQEVGSSAKAQVPTVKKEPKSLSKPTAKKAEKPKSKKSTK